MNAVARRASVNILARGAAVFFALFCLSTVKAAPLGEADARHLLERSGFGAPPALLAEFAGLERRQAIDRLLDGPTQGVTPPPALSYERPARLKNLDEEEKKRVQRELVEQGLALRGWWLQQMIAAPTAQDALRERMTLFWHNHFVSSQRKVKSAALMLRQNELFRRQATGNFGRLLHAVARDPAMLIYLDGASNRQDSPNENFAREIMELFTLGEGHYAERDIKEVARAFTGLGFAPQNGDFVWRPRQHDDGVKEVLGRRGRFDPDDVLDILLAQPAAAEFIVGKLWREFVSPTPDSVEVRRIAGVFRNSGYDIRTALRALFGSEAFWAADNRLALIKAPVDIVAGTLRSEGVRLPADSDPRLPVLALRNMGQDLFAPPNVRGWPGGDAWVDASSLLARKQFLERIGRLARREMRDGDMRGMDGETPGALLARLQTPSYQLR